MNKKIILYTSKTCGFCKALKEEFTKENIQFEEKTNDEYPEEWYKVNYLTRLPIFPTIVIESQDTTEDVILVSGRDFNNAIHAVNAVDYIMGPEYPNYSQQSLLLEEVKTLNYTVNNMYKQLNQAINNINKNGNKKSN